MSKRTLIAWIIEFAAVTAIAVILGTTAPTWWIVVPVVFILAAKLCEYVIASRERHEIVRRQLQVFLALLPRENADVRCTYHYPARSRIRGRVKLVQAFDYVPHGGGGGRRFNSEKGIIAKVYAVKGPRVENFINDEEYREQMVHEYNYSVAELQERRADRRSYACYPILDETHTVLGLIYVDADVPGTFTEDIENPRWRALNAAAAVVREAVLRA